MRLFEAPLKIDNKNGLGAVPDNSNVDYLGFTVHMKPRDFLQLNPTRNDYPTGLRKEVEGGAAIAPPSLSVKWHDEGRRWRVVQHEGRGRMMIAHDLHPEEPVPVQIFPREGLRARHLTPEHLFAPIHSDMRADIPFRFKPERVIHAGAEKRHPRYERAEHLIRAALLGEHITDYGNGAAGFTAFLKGRSAAWISPRDEVYPLNTPNEHHHDWARSNEHVHKIDLGPIGRTAETMNAHGWIRKMDHDQYIVGDPERDTKKVLDHVAKHHPGTGKVWIAHQSPGGSRNTAQWHFKNPDGSWEVDEPVLRAARRR